MRSAPPSAGACRRTTWTRFANFDRHTSIAAPRSSPVDRSLRSDTVPGEDSRPSELERASF
ncbi:MAG TPA: hypothetical protein DCQ98_03710 [Planctomycetaceae bacterium]|nr:hypothetical protein [Planctomycetaceae bacterium]